MLCYLLEEEESPPIEEALPEPEESLPPGEEASAGPPAAPWFISGGVTYNFTSLDCDPGVAGEQACSNPIQAAIDYVGNHRLIPDDLTIHIEAGTFTENVSIDGDTAVNANNINLQYVRYLTGAGSEPVTGVTVAGGGYKGKFIVNTDGAITLANVEARDNKDIGVHLHEFFDLGGGAYRMDAAGAGITVTDSVFNHNGLANDQEYDQSDLYVISDSIVTIDGVSARDNMESGVFVQMGIDVTVKNSVMLNNGMGLTFRYEVRGRSTVENVSANFNQYAGIFFEAPGELVMRHVEASHNSGGAAINTCSYGGDPIYLQNYCVNSYDGNVSIYDSVFNDNGRYPSSNLLNGLEIIAKGDVLISETKASGNNRNGMYIINFLYSWSPYDITLTHRITLAGAGRGNTASGNGWSGVAVTALSNISIQNLTANDNGGGGLAITNYSFKVGALKPQDGFPFVVVSDCSFFNNKTTGVYIYTSGPITLHHTSSSNNSGGAFLYNNPDYLAPTGARPNSSWKASS
ncbi:MAG: right-handed parallel beta-helix repeat-containing protein [Anaerolineae bacterium]|nr:right-handed parallel beta-helix repeat-containing protein [Anaerolineae bacterium]